MNTITVRRLGNGDFAPETNDDARKLAGVPGIGRPDRGPDGGLYPKRGDNPCPVAGDRYGEARRLAVADLALLAGYAFTVLPAKAADAPAYRNTDGYMDVGPVGFIHATGVTFGPKPETPKESAERVLSIAVRLLVETRKRLDAVAAPAPGHAERYAHDAACGAVGTAVDAAKDAGSKNSLPVYRNGYVVTYDDDGEVRVQKCRVD